MSISNEHLSLLRESVAASNRTTHAVRALVRFLFIQLSAVTLAAVPIYFGIADQRVELIFFGVFVWLIGLFWSSYAGWDELDKSNPDKIENRGLSFEDAQRPAQDQRDLIDTARSAQNERDLLDAAVGAQEIYGRRKSSKKRRTWRGLRS
jgi:hypothetical protein